MNDRNLVRGLFLMAIALVFGVTAVARYPLGDFQRPGPGLFPALISALLGLVGVATVIRSRFMQREKIAFNLKNIAMVLGSLCAFALVSQLVNMTAGIVALVFVAAAAGSSYSVVRNVKISLGLVAVAFAFYKLLGVQLPLY